MFPWLDGSAAGRDRHASPDAGAPDGPPQRGQRPVLPHRVSQAARRVRPGHRSRDSEPSGRNRVDVRRRATPDALGRQPHPEENEERRSHRMHGEGGDGAECGRH
jgi:hypothetical protein